MNCPIRTEDTAEILLAYTARRLDSARTVLLEHHMDSCPECAEFRAGQELVWQALDAWDAPPVTADFNRRLYQRIDAEQAAPWYVRLFNTPWASWKPALPLAAAGVVLIAGFVLDHPASAPSTAPASGIRVTVTEAEQVETALDDLQLLHQLDSGASNGTTESM